MKQLSSKQIKTIVTLQHALDAKAQALQDAVEAYNDKARQAWTGVQDAEQAYNDAAAQALGEADEIMSTLQDHYEAQPETWRDSEEGNDYQNFVMAWEDFGYSIEDSDLDPPEELEFEANMIERLDALPIAPE